MRARIIFTALYVLVLVYEPVSRILPWFGYFDELLMLPAAIGCYQVVRGKRQFRDVYRVRILCLLGVYLSIGLASSLVNQLQPSYIGIIKDIVAFAKFYILFVGFTGLLDERLKQEVLQSVVFATKIYLLIAISCAGISLFVDVGMGAEERLIGIKAFRFIYSHPTFMATSACVATSIILAYSSKDRIPFAALGILLQVLTFRNKVIPYIVALITCAAYCAYRTKKVGLSRKMLNVLALAAIIIIIIAFIVSLEKIMRYVRWGTTAARPAMYFFGLRALIEFFPLGAGFCTFGSSLSGEYYSELYYKYKMSHINGMTPTNFSYIGDTFWPSVFGQFGVFGTLAYVGAMLEVARFSLDRAGNEFWLRCSVICLISYWVCACFVEAMPTNASCLTATFALALLTCIKR